MKLKKAAGTFDTYNAEMSYAELVALQGACGKAGDPIADSMAEAVNWYLTNELPGPGETKDAKKPAAAAGDPTADATDAAEVEADTLLPDAVADGPAPRERAAPDEAPPEKDEIDLPLPEPSERSRVD